MTRPSRGAVHTVWHCCYLLVALATWTQSQSLNRPRTIDSSPTVTESLHHFTRDIYSMLTSQDNLVVSPLSLHSALSLTALGARGSTQDQILQTLRLSPESLRRSGGMANMLNKLRVNDDDVVMDLANFLWVPRGVAIKADFARTVQDVFQTRVRDADFSRSELVRQLVNRRISNMTRGHIQDLLPQGAISPQTKMLLANAIYFKSDWLKPFDRSQTFAEPFFATVDGSRPVSAIMMHAKGSYQGAVLDDLDAKSLFMPYQNNRYGLLLVLPNRNNGLSDLEKALINRNYTPTSLLRKMFQRDVNITLPKFNLKFNVEMSAPLQQMGIQDLFSNEADLSAMSSSAGVNRLRVSNVFHQATLEVNEGGSEASAASGLEITPLFGLSGYRGPIDFTADHPFLFYLIDRDNENIPLFMGRMVNPLQERVQFQFRDKKPVQVNRNNRLPPVVNSLEFPQEQQSNSLRVTPLRVNRPSTSFQPELEQILLTSAGSPSSLQGFFNQIRRNPLLTELLLSSIRQSEFSSPVQFPDEDDHLRRHRRQATDQSEELGDFWWEQRPGQTIPESTTQAAQQAPASLSPTEEEIEEETNLNWFLKPANPLSYIPLDTTKEEPLSTTARPVTTTRRPTRKTAVPTASPTVAPAAVPTSAPDVSYSLPPPPPPPIGPSGFGGQDYPPLGPNWRPSYTLMNRPFNGRPFLNRPMFPRPPFKPVLFME